MNDSASCLLILPAMSSTSTNAERLPHALPDRGQYGVAESVLHETFASDSWMPPTRQVAWPMRALDWLQGAVIRRWRRERRRRAVGRAYDMALEIARVVPRGSEVLDVGCGNGFIAHHLSSVLGTRVLGIDLGERTGAPIDYQRYDGIRFPVPDRSFDAVLLCYVLHHAQDVGVIFSELRRTLRDDGVIVVYEDIPANFIDRAVCWSHNLQWRNRTGPCAFRHASEWSSLFKSRGFEIVAERRLSRWRNLTHPVERRFYVLKLRGIN